MDCNSRLETRTRQPETVRQYVIKTYTDEQNRVNTFIYLLNDENKYNNLTDGFINGGQSARTIVGDLYTTTQKSRIVKQFS